MKKTKICLIVILLVLVMFPVSVFAAGSITPSPRSLSITKGGTKTFTIKASNACGRVDISSSNSSVAKVNVSSQWLENNSVTVTVTGVSAGSASITVKLSDAATFDEQVLSGSYTVSVTVTDPQASSGDSNKSSGTTTSSSATTAKPTANTNNESNKNLSKNNNVKGLSVQGYDIKNTGNDTYELTVNNNVTNITINGEAEDSKAKISGTGKKDLSIGKNEFTVAVTAESGAKKDYKINVTRKDAFYLEDLDAILKEENEENNIVINNDSVITEENIKEMKESSKKVTFNYYNEDKKLIYSWSINGSSIKEQKEINTNIEFASENSNKIKELANYADGVNLNFKHSGDLPSGTMVKLYVGDKFEDNSIVNLYYYNKETNQLELTQTGLVVKDGYIEFELKHCSEYFVTMSTIQGVQSSGMNIFMIIAIIELTVLLAVLIMDFLHVNPISKIRK